MVSITMATFNKAKYLDLTLAGYQKQSYQDFEIIIVDDGSTDNTKEVIQKYQKLMKIIYIRNEKKGISKARKIALENATQDYVIITDDDRIPCEDFVYEHIKKLDHDKRYVNIGKECLLLSFYNRNIRFGFKDEFKIYNLYPELLELEEKQMFTTEDILQEGNAVLKKFYLSDYKDSYLLEMVKRYGEDLELFPLAWSKAYGGNLSFNKNLCSKSIEYDTNYVGYGIEDIDIAYQLYLQGFNFRFSSLAVNFHQEHPRSNHENRDMYKNFEYFCKKYQNLDVLLMKMDWDGLLTLEDANDFYRVLMEHKDLLKSNVTKFMEL